MAQGVLDRIVADRMGRTLDFVQMVEDATVQGAGGTVGGSELVVTSTHPDYALRLFAALSNTKGWRIASDHDQPASCTECRAGGIVIVAAEHVDGQTLHFDVCSACGFTMQRASNLHLGRSVG